MAHFSELSYSTVIAVHIFASVLPIAGSIHDHHRGNPVTPHFKWGQTLEKVFLTIAVRGIQHATVQIKCEEDYVHFDCLGAEDVPYRLDLELSQDVDSKNCRWEHLNRRDRWGDAVFVILLKVFPIRWDALTPQPALYRHLMDRDWAREDQTLEPGEDDPFFVEHKKYLPQFSATELKQHSVQVIVVILVRHAGCHQCKVVDDTFAEVAQQVATAPTNWQARIRMGVIDPLRDRALARVLGARCAQAPLDCRHFAFTPEGDGTAIPVRGRQNTKPLLADLQRLSREQFQSITLEVAQQGAAHSSRALLVLPPEPTAELRNVAHQTRSQVDVRYVKTPAEAEELGILQRGSLVMWPPFCAHAFHFTGSPNILLQWVRIHALPFLAETTAFEDDEPYEELGLPVARLFLNGSEEDATARGVVAEIAEQYIGRMSFMVRNATSKAYEWRQHGLPAGCFPAFAISRSMHHNATRFAFLDIPLSDIGEFWKWRAKQILSKFVDKMLAGQLEPSYMSEAPSQDRPVAGKVQKLVGRQCRMLCEASTNEALVEGYDEWRRDHPIRTMQLNVLAKLLSGFNVTVYRLDLGYNECPPGTLSQIPAGYSGYFWIPRLAKENGLHPKRLKKLDPSFDKVIHFLSKHSEANINASIILTAFEQMLSSTERWERISGWVSAWRRVLVVGSLLGFSGLLLLGSLRTRLRPGADARKSKAD